ncbi:hypothetical protein DSCA_11130 [Desulfosarcina alkanivorans]|uniref:DUF3540 domain-containing protein n=1 Tax=Desulfosarcina alkanivorans TaxID=571177 RepID=A0A5K7YF32_9BACT|nr:DUF3540 domain-containing protein [Desulfosarcina alkanivorans]BBO67183.1 hypothetical protein DSCA_11130 [Desulfosarcina alkanivorans]
MPRAATIVPLHHISPTIEPAVVKAPCDPEGCLRIRRADDTADRRARMALYPRPAMTPGDEVLTMTDAGGETYIVGILSCRPEDPQPADKIRLSDGSVARIEGAPDDESLKLYTRENELLVDYRSQTGTVKIHAPSGNLEFAADRGGIAFHAARDIRMDGHRVALNGRHDLHMGVQDPNGGAGPTLSMKTRKMALAAPVLDLTARRAQLFLQETRIAGKKMIGRVGDVRFIARKIESAADTVMARARNVYRTISELSQLKAGRQRTLIEKTSHMKARKTIMKSDQDFKVKAEKIHLG